MPLGPLRTALAERYELIPTLLRTGGPARYWEVAGTGVRLGLITPLSDNFCTDCNRIRVSATGIVFGCLGHDQSVELRDLLREQGPEAVGAALDTLIAGKPRGHDFIISQPAVARHMSATGG